ncbi:MAG: protease HtpX [Thiotrichales bacterium]|jgi:heat shock protein HtpX|nr:protease HtpX [Thiotrichales bacterium]
MGKRIFLFLLTNVLVIAVAMLVLNLLGVGNLRDGHGGMNLGSLAVFALVWGFAGSFISLAMSKWMAKQSVGAVVITNPATPTERWLLETVKRQAQKAGIGMPEVAIYESPEPNAFATGMTKNSALVAVSTGLLERMTQDEVEAVLGHEVAHVANGDMVTMALLQGVLNAFVIFFAKIIANIADNFFRSADDEGGTSWVFIVVDLVMNIVLGILASMVTAWFSRYREFHADEGGAYLAGREKMIAALRRLATMQPGQLPDQMAAFGISSAGTLSMLFHTHPPLEERIAALEAKQSFSLA